MKYVCLCTSTESKLKPEIWAVTRWAEISWNGEIMGFKLVFETVHDDKSVNVGKMYLIPDL